MNDQAKAILEYLEMSYTGARMSGDADTMLRLSRAIVAFQYDTDKDIPGQEELMEWYIAERSRC